MNDLVKQMKYEINLTNTLSKKETIDMDRILANWADKESKKIINNHKVN